MQDALAKTNRLRGDLDILIVTDELDGLLKREAHRRGQRQGLIGSRGAHIAELFALIGVHDQLVLAVILADDLAAVDRLTRMHKEGATILQAIERVGGGIALLKRDHRAAAAPRRCSISPRYSP